MYIAIITIHPVPGEESRTIEILDSMQGLTATIPDCQSCSLTVEAREGKSICYMERWLTRRGLDRHLRSSLYSRVLEAMELSCKPPQVEFFAVQDIGGLELVEKARLCLLDAKGTD